MIFIHIFIQVYIRTFLVFGETIHSYKDDTEFEYIKNQRRIISSSCEK